MKIRHLLFLELHIVVLLGIIAVLVWRYWYVPRAMRANMKTEQAVQVLAPRIDAAIEPVETKVPAPAVPAPQPVVPAPAPQPVVPVATTQPGATAAQPVKPVTTKPANPSPGNLVKNGSFIDGLAGWSYWQHAGTRSNQVKLMSLQPLPGYAVRIEDPQGDLMGIQQSVKLDSSTVYKLSAKVRSLAGSDKRVLFGARVGLHFGPKDERELTWVTEHNEWWVQSLTFTNTMARQVTLFVHMGYGNVCSTGEFADVKLERVQ